MAKENTSGSRFIVDLGNVKLSDLLEKQVEAEIQAVVLRALAQSGFSDQQRDNKARNRIDIWDEFPGRTLGLWPGFPNRPPTGFPSEDLGPLVVTDHTLIMRAIMDNPLQVLRHLPDKYKTKGGRPPGKEVLQAALQVEQIDSYVKDRIRAVLDILPKIEEGQAELPESVKKAVDDLRQQLAKKTVEEKRSVFRDAGRRSRHREDGLAEGMEVAAQILEHGQDSIYSPSHSFYNLFQGTGGAPGTTARDATFGDLADTDGVGATAGGGIGFGVGGAAGAATGAVAGGVGASAGFAIAWAIDTIWDLF